MKTSILALLTTTIISTGAMAVLPEVTVFGKAGADLYYSLEDSADNGYAKTIKLVKSSHTEGVDLLTLINCPT